MWLPATLALVILVLVCWWSRGERATARWRVLAFCALLCAGAAVYFFPEPIILQKIGNRVIMPCGIVWFAFLAVLIYALRQSQFRTAAVLGAALALYTLLGNDWISHRLAARLESPFAKIQPFEAGQFDAVFVLGGGTGTTPAGVAQLDWGGDRVMLAARMFERGQIGQLITTGERIEGLHMIGRDPSKETGEMWRDLGIPAEKILTLDGRNTREEMQGILKLQQEHQWKRVGVISSAGHLNRVLQLAEQVGLKPEPLPSNFEGAETPWTDLSLVPDSAAMYTNHKTLKEYLAGALAR